MRQDEKDARRVEDMSRVKGIILYKSGVPKHTIAYLEVYNRPGALAEKKTIRNRGS